MLSLNVDNICKIDPKHGLDESNFRANEDEIKTFLHQIDARSQGFDKVIDDEAVLKSIEAYAASVEGRYDEVVICGIGGSSLGPICLREAFTNFFTGPRPHLHVLENIDPDFLGEAVEHLALDRTLFLIISKSGGTPETIAQYMFFRDLVDKASLKAEQHFVFVTDPEKSLLRDIGNQESLTMFDIPPSVGGRFSVQTAVGLLPAALLGIDIRALIKGMQDMRDCYLSTNFDQNLSYQLALVQFEAYNRGKPINILMPYHTKLRQFGAWAVQLIAESTGKFKSDGSSVGITPIPSLGVTDQHSQVQLFAEGPNDKLVIFIGVESFKNDLVIPVSIESDKTNFLKGKTFKQLIQAEQKATAQALSENNRPNITIMIPELTPYYLGQLFMLFEGATAFLGEFFEIDAFNQPGVERGKILTRELLV